MNGRHFVSFRALRWSVYIGLLLLPCALRGEQRRIEFDPAQTKVEFTLGDVLHTVHGTFHLKSGSIQFDTATGAASGDLIVDAASGDSGNGSRDRKMKREILQTNRYPEITFTAMKVIGPVPAKGSGTVRVQGIFRIHGADHNLTLVVPVRVDGSAVAATTDFWVPYVEWGMKNPSTFILRVDQKVEISIAAVGHFVNVVAEETH